MSNVIYTNFGNIGQIQPTVVAYVNQAVRDATQNSVQQSGSPTAGTVAQYTANNTVESTPYTLPTTTGVDGQTLVVSGGNLVYGAGGGIPAFTNTLTVTNLYQGVDPLIDNPNYLFPTTLPPQDGNVYAITGQDLGQFQPARINVAQSSLFSFSVITTGGTNNFNFQFTLSIGLYALPDFVEFVRSNVASAFAQRPNVPFTFTFNFDTPSQRFYFFITSAGGGFIGLNSAQITGGNLGNGLLGGNVSSTNQFVVSVSPIYYPNVAPTYQPPVITNQLQWRPIIPVSDTLTSTDGSSSIICTDVGIGGSVIGSQGNWNYNLGNLQNVGSISSTADTLTLSCGQSQLQLASIADGTSQPNASYLSAGDGTMNTAFASTVGEALIVRDGGTGTVLRVNVGAETILKNALDRECIRVYDYGVQLRGEGQPAATGVRSAINLDGDIFFNREDAVFGLKEIFLTQGTDTRIWSPSTISEVDIDESYIKLKRSNVEKFMVDDTGTKISQSYYLPTADGSNLQVMTTNGHGVASWQTPVASNPFNQSLNTADNVAFNNITTNIVDSFNTLELGKTNALGVNIGKSGITTNIKGTTQINSAYTLPTTLGTTGQVLTVNSGPNAIWASPQILGFYSQTTPVTVASTAVQTSIIGTGVGSLSVPANYFTIGMGFTYRTGGLFGALNNATIRFRLTNSGTLFDSGLLTFTPAIASGRPWNIDVTFIYIGGSTMITNFNFQYNTGADARGFTAQNTNNTFNPTYLRIYCPMGCIVSIQYYHDKLWDFNKNILIFYIIIIYNVRKTIRLWIITIQWNR
jgi:hypothetical protein